MKIDLYKMIIETSTVLAVTHGTGQGGIPEEVRQHLEKDVSTTIDCADVSDSWWVNFREAVEKIIGQRWHWGTMTQLTERCDWCQMIRGLFHGGSAHRLNSAECKTVRAVLKRFADAYRAHLIPREVIIAQTDHGCTNLVYTCSADFFNMIKINKKELLYAA